MGLIRDIDSLEPVTRAAATKAVEELKAKGISFLVNETLRLRVTQYLYYLQGRAALDVVNLLRQDAGFWPLTASENQKQVTQTLKSKHIDGKALDIAPTKNGQVWWDAPAEVWQAIADIMKSHGFEWGGDWKEFKDSPHYQLKE